MPDAPRPHSMYEMDEAEYLFEKVLSPTAWRGPLEQDRLDACKALARLVEQLEALEAERDRLREGVNDAANILDVIGKWFTDGADTSNMKPILDYALPMMEKWEAKLAALSNPATKGEVLNPPPNYGSSDQSPPPWGASSPATIRDSGVTLDFARGEVRKAEPDPATSPHPSE